MVKSWLSALIICIVIIVLLWAFYSDGPQEYVGIPNIQDVTMEPEYEVAEDMPKVPLTPKISFETLRDHPVISNPMDRESNGERITRRVFEHLFKKPFTRIRPDFLKNPETGRNLELDGYNEELKVAFEYNGMQHYCFPNGFNKTKQEFEGQLRRDKYKMQKCNEHGIYLITVPYSVSHENILHYVWHQLHPLIRDKTSI
jgi:hypothetical protein